MMKYFWLALAFASMTIPVACAQNCTTIARTCLQGAEERLVDGYWVTRDCWQWQEEKTCSDGESVDHCEDLAASDSCALEKEECLSVNAAGVCAHIQRTYACTSGMDDLPDDNTALPVRTQIDTVFNKEIACQALINDPTCVEKSHVCTQGAGTQTIDGVDVTLACWAENYTYACETTPQSLACALLGTAGCTFETTIEQTSNSRTDRYACLANVSVPTHEDIVFLETMTVIEGFETDDSACQSFDANSLCTLETAICTEPLTDNVCGTENRTYRCPGALDTDACKLLNADYCELTSEACIDQKDDTCLNATANYTCTQSLPAPLPDSIVETGRGETIEAITPTSTCPTFSVARARSGSCSEIARTCTMGAATKIVNGEAVTKDCWQWLVSYRCEGSGETLNGCTTWEADPRCEVINEECLSHNGTDCTYSTRTYRCEETPTTVIETQQCTESVCAYGFCETKETPPNNELFNSVLKLEVARQAAVYGDFENMQFFKGEAAACRNKSGGVSCCYGKVRADMSNQSGLGAMYVFGAHALTETVKTVGSPYVYDVLSSHDSMKPLLDALYGQAANSAYSPSLSYYGVTVSYGANGMVFEFNPYVFFAMIAIEVATDYLSCEPEEQALQLKRGQNLCVYLGSRCSQYSLGSCLIKEEKHCCYNSRLARIVQEAAHEQLGLDWGDLDRPNCEGLTTYQFMTLDFTKIDLSEFLSDIANQTLARIDPDRTVAQAQARHDQLQNQTNKYPASESHTDVCANGSCPEATP